jgi:hypothetical protein
LRGSFKECNGGLSLGECGLHIRVSRPDLVRNLIAFGTDFRIVSADIRLGLRQTMFSCAPIKDCPVQPDS